MVIYSLYQKAQFLSKRPKFVGRTLRRILPTDLAKLVLGLADEELYYIYEAFNFFLYLLTIMNIQIHAQITMQKYRSCL
jgi:hypothetical protein